MIRFENECVHCGLPCLGNSCPNANVKRYYCDECGEEFQPEELYDFDDKMVCGDCLLGKYDTVAQNMSKWEDD